MTGSPASPWIPGPVLGIESSCDETAAAVLDPRESLSSPLVLSDVVASQVKLHAPHGGVVPELACRQHLRDMRPVVEEALRRAGVTLPDLAGIAVTAGPGLVGALLVGTSFAKSLALGRGLPLVGVHHLDGHVRAAFLGSSTTPAVPEPAGPYLALVVSGGHTSLFLVRRDGPAAIPRYTQLAKTLDDAAGEAFDKVGKLLGLGYPAGPVVDRLARSFRGVPVRFPRARIKPTGGPRGKARLAFSFSGIKTSIRHHVQHEGLAPLAPGEDPATRPDLLAVLAGFQEAVVDMLVTPTLEVARRLAREEGVRHVVAVGGVSANSLLRQRLTEAAAADGITVIIPPPRWSTDNAAMIAAAGILRLAAGMWSPSDLSADPTLVLATEVA